MLFSYIMIYYYIIYLLNLKNEDHPNQSQKWSTKNNQDIAKIIKVLMVHFTLFISVDLIVLICDIFNCFNA